jgi:anthranilate synthase/aminodeoxychorismate synthase-like glutamine amidotransferase
MLLIVDNYDSFTYNLVQLAETVARDAMPGLAVEVVRNDAIDADAAEARKPTHLIVSPGPCSPREAGASSAVIERLANAGVPTLGVCLGHQCIADRFGGEVIRAKRIMHGKTDRIRHDGRTIFKDVPQDFVAARYHSLAVRADSMPPDDFEISATTDDGEIMALRHRRLPLEGVQFHPESFMTEHGDLLLRNFLRQADR